MEIIELSNKIKALQKQLKALQEQLQKIIKTMKLKTKPNFIVTLKNNKPETYSSKDYSAKFYNFENIIFAVHRDIETSVCWVATEQSTGYRLSATKHKSAKSAFHSAIRRINEVGVDKTKKIIKKVKNKRGDDKNE